uniref:Uncharacterized protein n=1 Tax=Megaselia scalaris TaxID=36166 RepID=T1GUB5_MEGSC
MKLWQIPANNTAWFLADLLQFRRPLNLVSLSNRLNQRVFWCIFLRLVGLGEAFFKQEQLHPSSPHDPPNSKFFTTSMFQEDTQIAA